MRPPVFLGDVVGKTQHVFVIAVVPLQGNFHGDPFAFPLNGNGGADGLLGTVQIPNKGGNTPLITKIRALVFFPALVNQRDGHAGIQERQFPQSVFQRHIIKDNGGKGFNGWIKAHGGALFPLRVPNDGQGGHGVPVGKAHLIGFSVSVNGQLQPL